MPLSLHERGAQRALSTSPILTRDADGCLQSVGTGLFVLHDGRAFVLSASHIFSEYMHTHQLLTGGHSVISLNQRFFLSRDENTCDVGFVPLTGDKRGALSDVRFLMTDDCDYSNDVSSGLHYIVGYRSDDNVQDAPAADMMAGWSLYGVRAASRETHEQRQLSHADRLLFTFDRHCLHGPDGSIDSEPAPHGLSGAGVWHITSANPSSDKLTAIVDSHTDSGKLIYAARLRRVMQRLSEYSAGTLS